MTLAPAKINLYLHIIGKRNDGYHLLDSIVMFANIGDDISIKESHELQLNINGPYADCLDSTDDNLVLKAATLLKNLYNIKQGANITLTKNLPIGAGLGGGSADAAATLKTLNNLWGTDLPLRKLAEIGLQLGADVPMCVYSKSAHVRGIGENLSPIHIPRLYAVLANPNIAVSSLDVYRMGINTFSGKANVVKNNMQTDTVSGIGNKSPVLGLSFKERNFEAFLSTLQNDLSENAISIAPIISKVLTALSETDNAGLVRMSGSGATCFVIYPSLESAKEAQMSLAEAYPHWWIKTATLG